MKIVVNRNYHYELTICITQAGTVFSEISLSLILQRRMTLGPELFYPL